MGECCWSSGRVSNRTAIAVPLLEMFRRGVMDNGIVIITRCAVNVTLHFSLALISTP